MAGLARPASATSAAEFHLGFSASSSTGAAADDSALLPFPAALSRSDFLAADFQPAAYLSALPHRHQTLEDLRADLRDRSSAISAELVDLVNANYTAFLSLGSELQGGEDRVEDVRVALLGFRRAVDDIRTKVAARRERVLALNAQLRHVRISILLGRRVLEISDRLAILEERLALDSLPADNSYAWNSGESDDDDSHDDSAHNLDGLPTSPPAKLLQSAQQCRQIADLMQCLDQHHPFAASIQGRISRCRNTLLLDLSNALKEARSAGHGARSHILRYLEIYRVLDSQQDAIKALRSG